MQPVDHFEIGIEIDALDRGHPGLENLEATDRAVVAALPRGLQARGPRRADAADEDEAGIAGRRHINGKFAVADFTFTYHCLMLLRFDVFSPQISLRNLRI